MKPIKAYKILFMFMCSSHKNIEELFFISMIFQQTSLNLFTHNFREEFKMFPRRHTDIFNCLRLMVLESELLEHSTGCSKAGVPLFFFT